MESLQQCMEEYREQLRKGTLPKAYRGLMEFILQLRTHFERKYPVSGLYYGYMDMTYFALFPEALKELKLKIAVVFVHEAFRFEVWLAAVNKQVQARYWQSLKESGWDKYRLVPTTEGADSILEHVLVEDPDFGDPDALTQQIETGTLAFIRDVESFLSAQQGKKPTL